MRIRKPFWRRWGLWVAAWLVLASLGTLVHWLTWIAPRQGVRYQTPASQTAVRVASAAFTMPSLPGWAAVYVTFGRNVSGRMELAFAANGAAWAGWLWGLWVLLRLRRRMLRDERAERQAHGHPVTDSGGATFSPGRRRLLVDAPLGIATAATSGLYVRAAGVEPWSLRVARYTVPIADLPPELDGYLIAHLTDTHYGPRVPPEFIDLAVSTAIDLKPDAFALTGDYIHRAISEIQPAVDRFKPLCATGLPVLGVLGNHDWYADGQRMHDALTAIGVTMLDNRRVYLSARTRRLSDQPHTLVPGEALCFAGLGDLEQATVNVASALGGLPAGLPRVVLAHQPDTAEHHDLLSGDGSSNGPVRVDLMLCGHTHGGQVALPVAGPLIVPSRFGDKYARGLVQGPVCPVVVSAGIGLSLVPVRFGVPPEVVLVRLQRA